MGAAHAAALGHAVEGTWPSREPARATQHLRNSRL